MFINDFCEENIKLHLQIKPERPPFRLYYILQKVVSTQSKSAIAKIFITE